MQLLTEALVLWWHSLSWTRTAGLLVLLATLSFVLKTVLQRWRAANAEAANAKAKAAAVKAAAAKAAALGDEDDDDEDEEQKLMALQLTREIQEIQSQAYSGDSVPDLSAASAATTASTAIDSSNDKLPGDQSPFVGTDDELPSSSSSSLSSSSGSNAGARRRNLARARGGVASLPESGGDTTRLEMLELLSAVRVFQFMDQKMRDSLTAHMEWYHAPRGELLFGRQGERFKKNTHLLVVKTGTVRLYVDQIVADSSSSSSPWIGAAAHHGGDGSGSGAADAVPPRHHEALLSFVRERESVTSMMDVIAALITEDSSPQQQQQHDESVNAHVASPTRVSPSSLSRRARSLSRTRMRSAPDSNTSEWDFGDYDADVDDGNEVISAVADEDTVLAALPFHHPHGRHAAAARDALDHEQVLWLLARAPAQHHQGLVLGAVVGTLCQPARRWRRPRLGCSLGQHHQHFGRCNAPCCECGNCPHRAFIVLVGGLVGGLIGGLVSCTSEHH